MYNPPSLSLWLLLALLTDASCLQAVGGAIRSLVLAPTRELAAQIKAEAVKLLQPHGQNVGVQVSVQPCCAVHCQSVRDSYNDIPANECYHERSPLGATGQPHKANSFQCLQYYTIRIRNQSYQISLKTLRWHREVTITDLLT